MQFSPIGIFYSTQVYPQQAGKQAVYSWPKSSGVIELEPDKGYEEALFDLDGFDRIWLIYNFHHNLTWKSKVRTPVPGMEKKGVFATRAPFRPNPIGLSCVRVNKICGLKIHLAEFDLLDRTPILDIKPYLEYADSFPNAKTGWTVKEQRYIISFEHGVENDLSALEKKYGDDLLSFIYAQLQFAPTWSKRKRITKLDNGFLEIAFRKYRIVYEVNEESKTVVLKSANYTKDIK